MELLPIQSRIYEVRGERIMFVFDLALLFDTETRKLKQSVKRNILRFPEKFMFILSSKEWLEYVCTPINIAFSINVFYHTMLKCYNIS